MRTFRFLLLSLLALTGSLTSSPAYSLSRGAANTPALSATPESMAFADFPVGVSSSPSPVEFTNTSDLQISIAAVSIVGMHSADFRIDSEDCQNSVLAPGNTCSVAVVFEPTSPGVRRGQLQLDGTPLGLRARVPLAGSSDVTFFDGFELAEPIPNSAPTADAGEDADTGNGIATALDGSGSFDPDGQPLIHLWQLQGPAGSSAALDNTGFASPSFTPDVVGDYLATLRVSDRTFVSAPDTVAVRALPRLTVGSRVLPTFFTDDLAISLEAAAGAGGVEISIANPAPSPVSAPAAIAVPQGDNSAAVPLESAALAGSTTIGASAPDYWPDQGLVTVQPRGMTFEVDPLVRIGGSNPGAIVLDLPAPTGGISVALASDLPGLVDLAPASVPIAAGETRAPITISGEGAGPASLSATATGYADAEATVAGTTTTVDLAIIPTLVVDDEIALAVSLSEPAPAGGVALELQSSDPTVLAVDASVFVAAGASAPDPAPLARALAAGTARVSVRATGYAPDFGDAEVLDFSLTFSPDPVAVPAGWTEPVTISLAQPAPAGGRTIELSSSDESLFTVPASVFVAEGDNVAGFEVAGIAQGRHAYRRRRVRPGRHGGSTAGRKHRPACDRDVLGRRADGSSGAAGQGRRRRNLARQRCAGGARSAGHGQHGRGSFPRGRAGAVDGRHRRRHDQRQRDRLQQRLRQRDRLAAHDGLRDRSAGGHRQHQSGRSTAGPARAGRRRQRESGQQRPDAGQRRPGRCVHCRRRHRGRVLGDGRIGGQCGHYRDGDRIRRRRCSGRQHQRHGERGRDSPDDAGQERQPADQPQRAGAARRHHHPARIDGPLGGHGQRLGVHRRGEFDAADQSAGDRHRGGQYGHHRARRRFRARLAHRHGFPVHGRSARIRCRSSKAGCAPLPSRFPTARRRAAW